jgi:hypothetical protein
MRTTKPKTETVDDILRSLEESGDTASLTLAELVRTYFETQEEEMRDWGPTMVAQAACRDMREVVATTANRLREIRE